MKGNDRPFGKARPILELNLTRGNYTAEVYTVRDEPQFENTESFIEVSYYNPKH